MKKFLIFCLLFLNQSFCGDLIKTGESNKYFAKKIERNEESDKEKEKPTCWEKNRSDIESCCVYSVMCCMCLGFKLFESYVAHAKLANLR